MEKEDGIGALVIIPIILAFITAAGICWAIYTIAHVVTDVTPGITLVQH